MSLIHELQPVRAEQLRDELPWFRREEIYLRPNDPFFPLILSGAMASSAVSYVLFVHNEVGTQAETSIGAYIYYGDAASFHELEFRTRLRIAGKNWRSIHRSNVKGLRWTAW